MRPDGLDRYTRVVGVLIAAVAIVVCARLLEESVPPSPPVAPLGLSVRNLQVVSAWALLVTGCLAPTRAARSLLLLAGATWLVPGLQAAGSLPAVTVEAIAALAVVPSALVVLALRLWAQPTPPTRPWTPATRVLVAAVLAGLLARALLVDPFDELRCWPSCRHNPIAVGAAGYGPWIVGVCTAVVGAVAAATAWTWAVRLRRGDPELGDDRPVTAVVLLAALAGQGLISPLLAGPAGVRTVLVVALALATVGLAVEMVARRAELWDLRVRLTDLVRSGDDEHDGSAATLLRRTLRDPGLDVLFWDPHHHGYVDRHGQAAPAKTGGGVHEVARNGEPVALVLHTRPTDAARLRRALGATGRLALATEQLRASLLAELIDLRASSAEVVEQSTAERRRLERNLHDGAQQRLVSLSILLRLVHDEVGPGDLGERITKARALAGRAAEDVRRMARGLYPVALADEGLAGALADLAAAECADRDRPVVQIADLPDGRFDDATEATAFDVVSAALDDARSGRARLMTIDARRLPERLVLEVTHDAPDDGGLRTLALEDQVRALSGALTVTRESEVVRVEVWLPCVP